MSLHSTAVAAAQEQVKRFYKPELDALRFFAFLGVLLVHGPGTSGLPGIVRRTGGFGLSMFFVLSAYLITELLLREREQNGTVAWRLFFTRRALRIWPLYYAALLIGVAISQIPPHDFVVSRRGLLGMMFFVDNWVPNVRMSFLLGPLWSISVEEQFYLVWPPIIKFGGQRLAMWASVFFMASAAVWLWIFSAKSSQTWFDTPVEFAFFAAGAIIAITTRGRRENSMNAAARGGLLTAGLILLVIAARVGGITDFTPNLSITRLYIGYGLGVAGCATVFTAILGMRNIPRGLIYLGKISYGLYVFHAGMLILSRWLTNPLRLPSSSFLRMFVVDGLALLFCIPIAHLSYQYFERPFLRLKERFEVIKSRPA